MTTNRTKALVHDKAVAYDAAVAHDRHWDVAETAKPFGLTAVAAHVLLEGDLAADAIIKERQAVPGLEIRSRTFEAAANRTWKLSDGMIEQILANMQRQDSGRAAPSVKAKLDQVPLDESDKEFIQDPRKIVDLYKREIAMIQSLLAVIPATSTDQDRANQAKNALSQRVADQGAQTPALFEAFLHGGSSKGISTGLRWGLPEQGDLGKISEFRPNLSVQDKVFAVAVMAYSNRRVQEKLRGRTSADMTKRIYLNPRIMDVPEIFSELLAKFNASELSVQMKMWGREGDLLQNARNPNDADTLRGDGIVVYTNDAEADEVLQHVLEVANHHAAAFVGRRVSKTPVPVASGISIGDEPNDGSGASLTAHRAAFLEDVAKMTLNSGKTGADAVECFRYYLKTYAQTRGINPDNIAFNS